MPEELNKRAGTAVKRKAKRQKISKAGTNYKTFMNCRNSKQTEKIRAKNHKAQIKPFLERLRQITYKHIVKAASEQIEALQAKPGSRKQDKAKPEHKPSLNNPRACKARQGSQSNPEHLQG